jgi:hypothetical protein
MTVRGWGELALWICPDVRDNAGVKPISPTKSLAWTWWGRFGWLYIAAPAVGLIIATSIAENISGNGLSGVSEVFGAMNSLTWVAGLLGITAWLIARYVRAPRRRYRRNRGLVVLGSLLLILGIGVIAVAALARWPTVTAIRTDATVQSALSKTACENGSYLKIAFLWHGRTVTEDDQSRPCPHDYLPGGHLVVYVASNSPTDPGADPQWVLDPSTHNPFDFIGPNGLPTMIELFGGSCVVAGIFVVVLSADRRRGAELI